MATQVALVVTEIGKPVKTTTRPIPVPKENEVLLKVAVAGLNPIDQKNRDFGVYIKDSLPAIIGSDIVGTVEKLGPGVSKFRVGDRAVGQCNSKGGAGHGVLQQYALLGTVMATVIPPSISFDAAATISANAPTAFIALFHSSGLGIPAPFSNAAVTFDYKSTKLVILGAGANCGKFGIQFAKLVGIGTVVAVAGKKSETELKSLGATHFIDRQLNNTEIQTQVRQIVDDELIYVYDAFNSDHTLAVSLLSNTKKGTLAHLLPGESEEATNKEKKAGFESKQVYGSCHMFPDIGGPFWKAVPGWLESGKLKPLGWTAIEGLDVNEVNAALDSYGTGKKTKVHVHP